MNCIRVKKKILLMFERFSSVEVHDVALEPSNPQTKRKLASLSGKLVFDWVFSNLSLIPLSFTEVQLLNWLSLFRLSYWSPAKFLIKTSSFLLSLCTNSLIHPLFLFILCYLFLSLLSFILRLFLSYVNF